LLASLTGSMVAAVANLDEGNTTRRAERLRKGTP
jgi:hypothetical protein